MNKNNVYKLGRTATAIIPFYRQRQQQEQQLKQKEIITTRLVLTMVIVAIVKIGILILWI